MEKICIKCNVKKSIDDFALNNQSKDKHCNICKKCISEYNKQYRIKNIGKERERTKLYYKTHKEERKKYDKLHKDERKKYQKEYKAKNDNREYQKKYRKKRIENDSVFKLKMEMRKLIRDTFKRKNLLKNNKRTTDILGCSIEYFKGYLESKFEPWMNWQNKGLYNGTFNFGWDIDHIISLSTAKTEDNVIKLNHYTNLQPLCSKINRDIKKAND